VDASDREQILKLLAESRDALVASAAGLSDEHAKVRPALDQWSVLECVEHVAFVEDGLFTLLNTRLVPTEPSGDRSRETLFLHGATNRARKFVAPEQAHPTGRFPTLAEALEKFRQARARSTEYVENCELDLRAHTAPHPVLGPVTGQEFLIVLALHPARHAVQIREVRSTLGLS
jgi:hypothetical protein